MSRSFSYDLDPLFYLSSFYWKMPVVANYSVHFSVKRFYYKRDAIMSLSLEESLHHFHPPGGLPKQSRICYTDPASLLRIPQAEHHTL